MLRRRAMIGVALVLALVAAGCGDDEATTDDVVETTAAAATTAAVVETQFDLVEVVGTYASTIPEGWMAVSDITAFKDALTAGALVIDVRETGEYAEGHIEGAINIPLRTLTQNLSFIPTDRQVFVMCKSGYRAGLATSSLRMLGYDNVLAFPPSWNAWVDAGEPVSMEPVTPETFLVPDIEPELLAAVDGFVSTIPDGWLSAGDVEAVKGAMGAGAFLLDVRSAGEYAEGHIPTATNVDLRTVVDNLDAIPTDSQVIVYCKSGWRASLSVPVLQVLGFENVKAFSGSYNAWTAAGEMVETS